MNLPKKLTIFLLAFCLCLTPVFPARAAASSITSSLYKSLNKKTLKKLQKRYSKQTAARMLKLLQKQEMTSLKNKINTYLKNNGLPASEWSVYVKNLNSDRSIYINKRRFTAASTIKLFTMGATYDKIQKKKLTKTSHIYSLLYSMITYSSNDAFNSLSGDYVGTDYINQFIKKNGFTSTAQYKGIGPSTHPYYTQTTSYGVNHTSAKDCGKLLEMIYDGKLVSKAASKEMLNLLKQQKLRSKIPAGIPSGITVANKTGEYENFQHDTAIVYGKKTTYIICIFSEDTVGANSYYHIQQLSRLVYNHLN